MNRSGRLMSVAVCAVLLALLVATSALADARGVTKDSIQLGMILVKTGPVAALGLPEGWAIQDTIGETNQAGGINGRKINFIWEDDQFRTPNAIAAFNKLIFRDKVLSIVTMGGTPQTIALFDLIDKHQAANIPNAMAEEFSIRKAVRVRVGGSVRNPDRTHVRLHHARSEGEGSQDRRGVCGNGVRKKGPGSRPEACPTIRFEAGYRTRYSTSGLWMPVRRCWPSKRRA